MDLPDPVRQRLGTFSRAVFSDSNRTGPEYNEGPENEMVSSLALQMSLYFNTYYFPLWWVSSIMMLHVKYSILPDYYKFIVITVIILITLIEAIRLYLGYMGNLQEKVTLPSRSSKPRSEGEPVPFTLHLELPCRGAGTTAAPATRVAVATSVAPPNLCQKGIQSHLLCTESCCAEVPAKPLCQPQESRW
ncbi:transmembrane protein 17 isoform X2 [Callithrix jacchus]|uniref:transmembrane protein 17 isoform X2 n=1 Tax=Callithrix jacchus TaxID=9483 RepID=UPI0023DD1D9D|nr:transmembrane protein 17 isoform X2 [Callithrix jacchus]